MKTLILTTNFMSSLCNFFISQNTDSSQFYFKKGMEEKNARLFAVAGKKF